MSIFGVMLEAKENKLEWRWAKPVKSTTFFTDFCKEKKLKYPTELLTFLKKNSGAHPTLHRYGDDQVLSSILTIGKGGSVYSTYKAMNSKDFKEKDNSSLLPFAANGMGDYICIKGSSVVLWTHEDNKTTKVAKSFSDLINKLH